MTFNPKNCPKCHKALEVDVEYDTDYDGSAVTVFTYECLNCGWVRR